MADPDQVVWPTWASAAQSGRSQVAQGSSVCALGAWAYRHLGRSSRAVLVVAEAGLPLREEPAWRHLATLSGRGEAVRSASSSSLLRRTVA